MKRILSIKNPTLFGVLALTVIIIASYLYFGNKRNINITYPNNQSKISAFIKSEISSHYNAENEHDKMFRLITSKLSNEYTILNKHCYLAKKSCWAFYEENGTVIASYSQDNVFALVVIDVIDMDNNRLKIVDCLITFRKP